MSQNSNRKILYLSIFMFFTIMALLLTHNFSNESFSDIPDDDYYIKIYGNTKETVYIGYANLTNERFERESQNDFYVYNRYKNDYTVDIIGVQIWDILMSLNLLNDNSSHLIFESSDGYKSPSFPLLIMENNPHCALLIIMENGNILRNKSAGGDGPIISAVSYDEVYENSDVLNIFQEELHQDFVYNSAYKVKYLVAIQIK